MRWGLALALAVTALAVASCGGGTKVVTTYVAAGQVPHSAIPAGASKAADDAATGDTIPLAKENPTTALFTAVGVFQSCLAANGTTFLGIPSASKQGSAVDNPTYIKTLTSCAAQSNILQALKAETTAQDNLTQSQVKNENQEYLKWRTCMIARGWGIPTPSPDAKGLLFSFGTANTGSNFKPPPGQSLLSSDDLQECATKALAGKS